MICNLVPSLTGAVDLLFLAYSGRAQVDEEGIYDQVLTIEVLTVTNLTKNINWLGVNFLCVRMFEFWIFDDTLDCLSVESDGNLC